jgi:hypothetical protein
MTTAVDVSFLEKVCDLDRKDSRLSIPHSLKHNGEAYAVATDGYHVVAVKTESTLPEMPPGGPNMEIVIFPVAKGVSVSLAELKAFVGAPRWPDPNAKPESQKCKECKGTGEVYDRCGHCDREGYDDCGECDGKGLVEVHPPKWPTDRREGYIGEALFDLERVARCLDAFTDETITVATRGAMSGAFFYTSDWIAMIMPIRPGKEPEDIPRFDIPTHSE